MQRELHVQSRLPRLPGEVETIPPVMYNHETPTAKLRSEHAVSFIRLLYAVTKLFLASGACSRPLSFFCCYVCVLCSPSFSLPCDVKYIGGR
jgi:hypothetical protein